MQVAIRKLPPGATAFDMMDSLDRYTINNGLVSTRNPLRSSLSYSLNEKPVKYVWGFCQGQVINNGIVVDERTYTFEFKLLIRLFNDEKKTLIEKILKSSSCTAGVALF